jgi:hypothetical protein
MIEDAEKHENQSRGRLALVVASRLAYVLKFSVQVDFYLPTESSGILL